MTKGIHGVMLAHNDLVEVTAGDFGTYNGYIRYFGREKNQSELFSGRTLSNA